MSSVNPPYSALVRASLAMTPIGTLLRSKEAVVLERIARGGGSTNWYYCRNETDLQLTVDSFVPGSVVSFYFDERIRRAEYSPLVQYEIEKIITSTGDAFVGVLADANQIGGTIVVGIEDLVEFGATIADRSKIFFGAFPARDNDGEAAVTVTLPDEDGVVRGHPH
jgi:hypothetical protein